MRSRISSIIPLLPILLVTGCATQPANSSTPAQHATPSKAKKSSLPSGKKTKVQSDKKPTSSGPTVSIICDDGKSLSLPVVGIKATYGVSYATTPPVNPVNPLPPVHFNLPSNQVDALTAYWVNEGYKNQGILFLGPNGWTPTSATVGADGSEQFTLQSPSDSHQNMTLADDGGCQACGIRDIGTYFPDQKQWASEKGYPPLSPPAFTSMSRINQNTMAYSLQSPNPGYETNGIAYMAQGENIFFGREEISLPTSQHSLETTILNFYTAYTVQ
jgi:hypothetical protein